MAWRDSSQQKYIFFVLHFVLFICLDSFGVICLVLTPLLKIIHRPCCEQFHAGTTFLPTSRLINSSTGKREKYLFWILGWTVPLTTADGPVKSSFCLKLNPVKYLNQNQVYCEVGYQEFALLCSIMVTINRTRNVQEKSRIIKKS